MNYTIKKLDMYMDGGTIVIDTIDNFRFTVDFRINTKTRGIIYFGECEDGILATPEQRIALVDALRQYNHKIVCQVDENNKILSYEIVEKTT